MQCLKQELNVKMLNHPSEMILIAKEKHIPKRVAISGLMNYSDSEASLINAFLTNVKIQSGVNSTGFITSPTSYGNNIDAIVRKTEGKFNTMPLFVVPEEFANYINPEQVPLEMQSMYKNAEKYVLPDKTSSSEAIAKTSKGIVVIGGGRDSLLDAIKQIEANNKVTFINMDSLPQNAWDSDKQCPKNAFKYLKDQIETFDATKQLKHPEYKEAGFTYDYVKMHSVEICFPVHKQQFIRNSISLDHENLCIRGKILCFVKGIGSGYTDTHRNILFIDLLNTNNCIIGWIIVSKIDKERVEIIDFFIWPEFRNNGYGESLLDYYLSYEKSHGIKEVFGWMSKDDSRKDGWLIVTSFFHHLLSNLYSNIHFLISPYKT
jgi:GNAT superfamily N-acetyltransferase